MAFSDCSRIRNELENDLVGVNLQLPAAARFDIVWFTGLGTLDINNLLEGFP